MKYILISLAMTFGCSDGWPGLPAPVNVTVHSVNFEHILRWSPGPGTPPHTVYNISCRDNGKTIWHHISAGTTMNMTHLLGNYLSDYSLSVQAVHAGVVSPASGCYYSPWTDTILGPPQLSLVRDEECLQLTLALPRGKAKEPIDAIYKNVIFNIFYRKAQQATVWNVKTMKSQYRLCNLEPRQDYCVYVGLVINTNNNTIPSNWTCKSSRPTGGGHNLSLAVPAVCGVIVLLVGGLLLGLAYTGFLCKTPVHHPLIVVLEGIYPTGEIICDPEMDPVSVSDRKSPAQIVSVCEAQQHEGYKAVWLSNSEEDHSSGQSAEDSGLTDQDSCTCVLSVEDQEPQEQRKHEALLQGESTDMQHVNVMAEARVEMEEGCADINLMTVTLDTCTVQEEEEESDTNSTSAELDCLWPPAPVEASEQQTPEWTDRTVIGSAESSQEEDEGTSSGYMMR